MERLDNSRWGLESNCFVCEEKNPDGLGVPFFADRDRQRVTATFALDDRFRARPPTSTAVWCWPSSTRPWPGPRSLAGCFAVTKETTTRFRSPVMVGESYEVRARVAADEGSELECAAEVVDGSGQVCAEAEAVFVALGPAQALEAAGAEVPDSARGFIRS